MQIGHVRWAQAARRHKIGRAHALFVMRTYEPEMQPRPDREPLLWWIGQDDRALELEVGAVDLGELLLVIHVMPTFLRSK